MNSENPSDPTPLKSAPERASALKRRVFLQMAGAGLAAATVARAAGASGTSAE